MTEYKGVEYESLSPKGTWMLIRTTREDEDVQYIDGVYVPMTNAKKRNNSRVGAAKILMVGERVKEFGLAVDDYILYDYFAATGNEENEFIQAENVLAKVTKEEYDKFIHGSLNDLYSLTNQVERQLTK